jgi:thymidylate kinase
MRHVVFEGLPAVGKSETLELLARFYPERVRALPELVKEIALSAGLDLFRDRQALTRAILEALPKRVERIQRILADGFLCLEESHLGVHLAYARALGDRPFVDAYTSIRHEIPTPDAYVRLEIPIAVSLARQTARGTPGFDVHEGRLSAMLANLDRWHGENATNLHFVQADRPAAEVLVEVEELLGLAYSPHPESFADAFDVLLLLGRPASGKSEFIDFMTACPSRRRASGYHIAPFDVVDDFPMLWELFEDDDLWEGLGRNRLYSKRCNGNYAVIDDGLWPFLIGKIDRAVKPALDRTGRTTIIEFSRGGSSGYADALPSLSDQILTRAAILYVSVSFEESWRRNIARYDKSDKGGILTHSVPRDEMEKTYGTDDWFHLAPSEVGTIDVRGIRVPYATMLNEPESKDPAVLGPRYRAALDPLFELRSHPR